MTLKPFNATLLALLLTGCAHQNGIVISDFCLTDKPISIGNDDVLTEQTAKEIEAHNLMWERKCEK